MTLEVAARRAAEADLPRVAELIAEAIEEQRAARGGALFARREARADTSPAGLAALLADGSAAYVGTIDDVTLGVGTAHVDVLGDGGRLAVVDEIYVEAGARGVGVGEALMDALVAWATAEECFGIDALVLPGNRESKNFFETFGLTARVITVHRALGGSA
jgi:L-amino acid N-acyltransferase YncA